ncbi:hypothetical protein [Hymenobacter fastidiosus]
MHTIPPTPPAFDFLNLAYRPDLNMLTVRWLRAVTFEELRQGFQAVLSEGLHYGATRWLVDVRRRTEMDVVPSQWVAQQLLPEAAAKMAPTVLYVAYLLSPSRADQLQSDPPLRAAAQGAQSPSQPYRLQTFLDEGLAVRWLQANVVS